MPGLDAASNLVEYSEEYALKKKTHVSRRENTMRASEVVYSTLY